MTDLVPLCRRLHARFSETADAVARQTGFVQRDSKLSGPLFLLVLVTGFLHQPAASLNFLAQVACDLGVPLTRQALHHRLGAPAVAFLRAMLQHSLQALHSKAQRPLPVLTQFTAVYLHDSTHLALPDGLAAQYPGAGGSGPKAGLKLQTTWEWLGGHLPAIAEQPGRQPDQGYREFLPRCQPGSLVLFDLGYAVLETLRRLSAAGVSFVTRLPTQTHLWHPDGTPCDLLAHLRQTSADHLDLALLPGPEAKLPCRLVAVRLPADLVEQRRRRARREAVCKGRQLRAEKLAWLAWHLYLTNVPAARLDRRQVVLVYRLRWQVELLFKLWKSEAQLDRLAGRCSGRVLSEVYAKLIGLVLVQQLSAPVRLAQRELSATKALRLVRRRVLALAHALRDVERLAPLLQDIYRDWARFGNKDRRRTRLSTCRQLELATPAA